ncbi:PH domain-containing protein [Actinotalea sp. K2]|uniref:PH domain-containing protein n=1 Tax=Actinotalea sp. K2 TaxID=2939438 RepID=UPI002016D1A1|nr:PH domain-containing protein [Actinotalea sp. K2]MCL3862806.1 PH domain-containing protein [Actinotalea sp. K2]
MTDRRAELHRPFRPRAARWVSWVFGVLVVVVLGSIVVVLPSEGPVAASPLDRAGIAAFAALVVWFLGRQAGVRADPDEDGLTVRNLVVRRRLDWGQVVSVRFGQGRPWVQLDLDDGDTLAVMAIQRADGLLAAAEAQRLATLVALHSTTDRDD